MPTHYDTLQVKPTDTIDTIKKSYRNLSKKWHPDKNNGSKEAEEKFKLIAGAWSVLSDPDKKKQYDRSIAPAPSFNTNNTGSFYTNPVVFWADVFSTVFKATTGQHNTIIDDIFQVFEPNVEVNLYISLLEYYEGCRKNIKYKRKAPCAACVKSATSLTCQQCRGKGAVYAYHTLQFYMPAMPDIGSEFVMVLDGEGNYNGKTQETGDLLITPIVTKQDNCEIHGADIHFYLSLEELPLPGEKIVIHEPYNLRITVPKNANKNTVLRIKQKGLKLNGIVGDLYVKF